MVPLTGYHWKYKVVLVSYISPLCILNNICFKHAINFSLEAKIVKNYLYLSKLAIQTVFSTPLENLSLLLYEPQNKNFNFGNTKTLILHVPSIFFRRGHITKIWSKKIFFMKTLSNLELWRQVLFYCRRKGIFKMIIYFSLFLRLL